MGDDSRRIKFVDPNNVEKWVILEWPEHLIGYELIQFTTEEIHELIRSINRGDKQRSDEIVDAAAERVFAPD